MDQRGDEKKLKFLKAYRTKTIKKDGKISEKNFTEAGEVARREGVGIVLVVVADGKKNRIELLQLHQVLLPHAVKRYRHLRELPAPTSLSLSPSHTFSLCLFFSRRKSRLVSPKKVSDMILPYHSQLGNWGFSPIIQGYCNNLEYFSAIKR